MPRNKMTTAVVAATLVCAGAIQAHAQPNARFCVVPVEDSAPTAADYGYAWLTLTAFRIPGLSSIVFTPGNGRHRWIIDSARKLVRYGGPYPHSFLDKRKWIVEPWSSRIVAITYGGGVSVLSPGSGHFASLDDTANLRDFRTIETLPRRKLTIVSRGNAPFVVGEKSLRPWFSESELAAHGVKGIAHLHDAPSLSATIIIDSDSQIHILDDEDHWQQIGSLEKGDDGSVFEARDAKAVLILGLKSVALIRKKEGSQHGYTAERLLTTRANGAGTRYSRSQLFHQLLFYDLGHWFYDRGHWQRLGQHGFENVPGGGIDPPPFGQPHDLPTLGKTLIEGADGLYLYDGRSIKPVRDGGRERIGKLPRVYDLPSIKRVLLSTQNGMFEITPEGALVSRPMPFSTSGLPSPQLWDWAESGVAVASTHQGLFVLDAHLNASRVSGGEIMGLGWLPFANGTNPGTGDLVLTAKRGVFLAVDSLRNPDGCRGISP